MGVSKYNGVILPALPTVSHQYAAIMNVAKQSNSSTPTYALLVGDQPFRASLDYEGGLCRSLDSNVEAFIANMTTYVWNRASIGSSDPDGVTDAQYAVILGDFVWANHDIYAQNAFPTRELTWNQVDYPYLLIQEDSIARGDYLPKWWAWYSAEPFVLDDLLAPDVGELAGDMGYGTFKYTTDVVGCQTLNMYSYGGAALTWKTPSFGQFTSDPAKIIGIPMFDPTTPAINTNFWANHDIVGTTRGHEVKANSWYQMLCYKASEPVEVPVPMPIDPAITGGNATYDQYTTAGEMWCTAGTPEGGRLSYKWYRYTDSEENAVVCGYTGTHTPSTLTAGVWHYFCEVTNNQYGGTATVRTVSVPITVNAVELPDNPDVPEAPKASKCKHIIGYVLKQCAVPMAELIAEMLCKGKIELQPATHYSYNGTVLPVIPVFDFTVNPYAVIVYVESSGTYYLEADDEKFVGSVEHTTGKLFPAEKYILVDGVWQTSSNTPLKATPVWSNHDIYYVENEEKLGELSGALFLAKSKPVPVYK